MKRVSAVFVIPMALAILITGCGTGTTTQHEQHTTTPTSTTGDTTTAAPAPNTEGEKKQVNIQVYYTDANLTKLEAEKKEVAYSKETDKYVLSMELLGKPAESTHEPLWKDFKYNGITLDSKGTLTIDAKGNNQYNIGSSGEAFAMDALKKTMFQFPEVKQIVILVDGKPAETLMGHEDVSQPFTR